jgi:hypothetical protein
MPPLAQAFVRVRADGTGLGRDLAGTVEREGAAAETAASSLGIRMGRRMRVGLTEQMKGVAAPLFASLAVFATIEGLKEMGKDAAEAAKETRLTASEIKSTGEAAHVTTKEVGELAEHLSEVTGKNAEVIHSGENLLLTFTQIRNRAGDNNDIFDQASAAIVDMTAAMNNGVVSQEGMKASSIQLGKALNNPISGMTALQRIGVSFTEEQKNQIKTMAENNNILGAQKVILKEVMTEFGGAAAASSSPIDRLQAKIHGLKVQIGEDFIPVANAAAAALADKVAPAAAHAWESLDAGPRIEHAISSSKELGGELATHLWPAIVDTWHAALNLAQIAVHLEQTFQPLVAAAAKLAVALSVGTIVVFAHTLADLTGFMARHQTLVLTLAAAYAIQLAGGLARVIFLARAAVWNTLAAAIELVFGATERVQRDGHGANHRDARRGAANRRADRPLPAVAAGREEDAGVDLAGHEDDRQELGAGAR